ncbi:MAG: methionyl-tRNA formyltransferase [Candidatus Omnitrophota bacterium]|nr:methionyl-tRNA formyltransferase [Candidatus Omnitrophota bacterium]
MKIVFFGTSDFAVPSLAGLSGRHDIAAVITKPDKPQGRHLLTRPSAVKAKAQELGLPAFSLEDLLLADAVNKLKRYEADLFVVIAYGRILPAGVLSLPKFYSIGLHASLLSKYRGASPINWALLNGERQTGVTVFKLSEKMDAGDIIMQEEVEILSSDNAQTLSVKLSEAGADLLLKAVDAIEKRSERLKRQKDEEATFTPRLKKEDGLIDWKRSAAEVHNKVRAMFGWPGAFSDLNGHKVKILATETGESERAGAHRPGEIIKVGPDGIEVSCGQGIINVKEVQAEGGKRLAVSEYLLGHKVRVGDFFLSSP